MSHRRYSVGDKVGTMTLLCIHKKVSYGSNIWKVVCDCGRESYKRTSDFWKLHSCGYKCPLHKTKERVYPPKTRGEQLAWHDIKRRCLDPEHSSFIDYGGRGISICKEWEHSFDAFYTYLGPRPSRAHSVDRIDNNKGYEPGNVRWATRKVQNNNKRNTIFLTIDGVTKPLSIWAKEVGVPHSKLFWRYKQGWRPKDVVFKP